MTAMPDLSAVLDFLRTAWLFFNEFLSWIVIAITLLGALWMYSEFKPKPKDCNTVELFVDDELCKLMERRELRISWGPLLFLSTLKLLDVSPETSVRLSSRPAGKLEVILPDFCSIERVSKFKKTVFLRNRRYFRETNVDVITAMLETPVGTMYRQKLHCQVNRLGDVSELVITNENAEEIRKYQLVVSKDIDPRSLDRTVDHVESLRIEIPFSQFRGLADTNLGQLHTLGLPIILEIRSIPGRHRNEPGTIRIGISSEQRGQKQVSS